MAENGRDILVVEDDRQLNELVGAYARLAGFGYHGALDGSEALLQARQYKPALIVLDIMLPDLDGFEVCRRLKGDEVTRTIPVLMLTALDRVEYREQGLQCGAAAYMTKPFDPERLLAAMKVYARGTET